MLHVKAIISNEVEKCLQFICYFLHVRVMFITVLNVLFNFFGLYKLFIFINGYQGDHFLSNCISVASHSLETLAHEFLKLLLVFC